jgi:hypothetical protein
MVEGIERLFEQQIAAWPMLARGIAAMHRAQTRSVTVNGHDVFIRHIPHRIASTTAAVDPESVRTRPCFLCPSNLPQEEKGFYLHSEFTAYCNPFPILDRHVTIVHSDHRPQRIREYVDVVIDMAKTLDGYFVIYNGPECGASAPDHLHFQACSRNFFPIEKDLGTSTTLSIADYARNVLILRDRDRSAAVERLDLAVARLSEIAPREPEPMLNIAVFYESGQWTSLVFPRGKHRPNVFHSGEITVSPATIDLCGVLVAPLLKDFQRISAENVRGIFEEVTLPADTFALLIRAMEQP